MNSDQRFTSFLLKRTDDHRMYMLAVRDVTLDDDEDGDVYMLTVADLAQLQLEINHALVEANS